MKQPEGEQELAELQWGPSLELNIKKHTTGNYKYIGGWVLQHDYSYFHLCCNH